MVQWKGHKTWQSKLLVFVFPSGSRVRLATLEMSSLLLNHLVSTKSTTCYLQDRHLAAIEGAREESTLLLRNFYKVWEKVDITHLAGKHVLFSLCSRCLGRRKYMYTMLLQNHDHCCSEIDLLDENSLQLEFLFIPNFTWCVKSAVIVEIPSHTYILCIKLALISYCISFEKEIILITIHSSNFGLWSWWCSCIM